MVSHVNKTHISSVNLPNVQTAILQQDSRGCQHYIESLTRGEESLCSETLDNVQKKERDTDPDHDILWVKSFIDEGSNSFIDGDILSHSVQGVRSIHSEELVGVASLDKKGPNHFLKIALLLNLRSTMRKKFG